MTLLLYIYCLCAKERHLKLVSTGIFDTRKRGSAYTVIGYDRKGSRRKAMVVPYI